MQARRRLAIAIIGGLAAASLAACGSDDAPENSGAAASSGGRVSEDSFRQSLNCDANLTPDQVLAFKVPKADRRYKVTLMEVSLAGYYYQGLAYGATKAAREAGVDLEIVAGRGYTTPEQQLKQMDNVIARKPDAILFAASDPRGSVPAVAAAKRAGIPVLNMSAEVESKDPFAFVLQDEYEMGRRGADQLARAVPEGGKGIVMGGPANALWSRKRVAGFTDRLKEKHPNLEVAETTNQLVDPAEGAKDFANAIQANPDAKWVYSTFVFQLPPDAIPDQYRELPYVTTGFEPIVIDALEDKTIDATLGVYNTAFGYIPLGRAVEHLNGDSPPRLTCLQPPDFTRDAIGTPLAKNELYPAGFKPQQ